MQLIGLTGKARSGKDTAAQIIANLAAPAVVQRLGFADAVKRELAVAMGCNVQFIEENKARLRPLLQGWGTEFRRNFFGQDYWINKWQDGVTGEANLIIVPDVRFANEANHILNMGGVVWRIKRCPARLDMHTSEIELDDYCFPEIDNNGTIEQLTQQLQRQYGLYSAKHPIS